MVPPDAGAVSATSGQQRSDTSAPGKPESAINGNPTSNNSLSVLTLKK
jgi:hypothetical protein